jgi:hypothetical protein
MERELEEFIQMDDLYAAFSCARPVIRKGLADHVTIRSIFRDY